MSNTMSNTIISGELIIGASTVHGVEAPFQAIDPATGLALRPVFHAASDEQSARAAMLAGGAFDSYRETTLEQRAALLENIAQKIDDLGAVLVERTVLETGIPQGRVEG